MLEGANRSGAGQSRIQDDEVEVEDVTDTDAVADQRYKAAIEEEYAKKEGGA